MIPVMTIRLKKRIIGPIRIGMFTDLLENTKRQASKAVIIKKGISFASSKFCALLGKKISGTIKSKKYIPRLEMVKCLLTLEGILS
jgi:hypothetical protein